jgi:hypothetical protein
VLFQDLLFLFLNKALLFFDLLLLLNNAEELVALLLSLFGKAGLAFQELFLTGIFHIFEHLLLMLQVTAFLFTSLSLSLLERSLRPQSVNLSLSVGCFFLKLTKSSHLSLLLLLDSLKFSSLFFLSLSL